MKKTSTLLLIYFIICLNIVSDLKFHQKITIGIYDDPPAIYLDNGFPSGYFFDIFDGIFKDNGYIPNYKYGTWDEIVSWLKEGKIDAVFDIASTEERKNDFDFNNETIFLSWGVIYGREKTKVSSFYDLENLRISVVENDVYYEGHKDSLKEVLEALKINAVYIETGGFNESVKKVVDGEADVCVLPREFADYILRDNKDFIQTPIIFKPVSVNIAFKKGSQISKELIPIIDDKIKKEKQDKDSNYYKSINKYTNGSVIVKEKIIIKKEIDYKTLIIEFFALGLVFIIIYSFMLKRKIKIMTKDLVKINKELKELSIKDYLTNIYNRRYFEEKVEALLKSIETQKDNLSFILIDIDYFKRINDNYGHHIGDEVLKSVGKILEKTINQDNILCRYGGEEFAICLPNYNLEDSSQIAENIRISIEKEKFSNLELKITITCGVSSTTKNADINNVIAKADEALYFGKNSGRNCTVVYTDDKMRIFD